MMKREVTVKSEGQLTVSVVENALRSLPSDAVIDIFYVTKEASEFTLTINGSWN